MKLEELKWRIKRTLPTGRMMYGIAVGKRKNEAQVGNTVSEFQPTDG